MSGTTNSACTDDQKDPVGTCCFWVPLKPGALTISTIGCIFSAISLIFTLIMGYWLMAVIALAWLTFHVGGTCCIYKNSHVGTLIYGIMQMVLLVSFIIMEFVYVAGLQCVGADNKQLTPEACRQKKDNEYASVAIAFILPVYFNYVLLECGFKLRCIAINAQTPSMA